MGSRYPAHTPQDCALALDPRRLALQHSGPAGHLAPRVAPELRNLGRCGEQRGVYFTQQSPGDGSRMGGRPSSPLDKQQQQHLKGEHTHTHTPLTVLQSGEYVTQTHTSGRLR